MAIIKSILIVFLICSSCSGILFNNKKQPERPHQGGMGVFRLMSRMMPLQDEAYMTGPELIKRAGYPLEIHNVETEDGYVLQVHRIPGGHLEFESETSRNGKKIPVLIQSHFVTSGSTTWVLFERNQSLPYLLADAGFDVWIGNNRGTEFSWHKEMSPKDYDFWKFTMHEIGVYDTASTIDYIIEKTGFDKIFNVNSKFVSMSNLILFSSKPQYNDKVILNVMLSPFWQFGDERLVDVIRGGVETVIDFVRPVVDAMRGDLWASTEFNRWLGRSVCYYLPDCFNIMNTIVDGGLESTKSFNVSRGPALMGHILGSYSARPIHHVITTIHDREVREYDWNPEENVNRYGRAKTEAYDLKKVSVETLLVYGPHDMLSGSEENEIIAKQIQHPIKYEVKDPAWSMIMTLAGIRNRELAYDHIIEMFKIKSKNVQHV